MSWNKNAALVQVDLEAEMKAGYWVVVPSDDAILFDDANETKWDRAMAKRRINL